MKLPNSKRLKFCIAGFAANFIIGGVGVWLDADLSDLGSFLALANSPIYAYVFGESYRKSDLNKQ